MYTRCIQALEGIGSIIWSVSGMYSPLKCKMYGVCKGGWGGKEVKSPYSASVWIHRIGLRQVFDTLHAHALMVCDVPPFMHANPQILGGHEYH